jgi:glucose/arabinose dehydrogenase
MLPLLFIHRVEEIMTTKALAALAAASIIALAGCAAAQSSTTASGSAAPSASASATPSPSATPNALATAMATAIAEGAKSAVASVKDPERDPKYLSAVRATVKKGTDEELLGYGHQMCDGMTSANTEKIRQGMLAAGYSNDDTLAVMASAGILLCPNVK